MFVLHETNPWQRISAIALACVAKVVRQLLEKFLSLKNKTKQAFFLLRRAAG